MALIDVEGVRLAYELIGEKGPAWVLTPGGRFSKDHPGVRETAQALAALGNRVLIWDRPNCGESDLCFEGASESQMQADKLAGLVRRLDLGPVILAGGSAGSRLSLLAVARHPELARALALWWITGGPYGIMNLGMIYCGSSIAAAWTGGMEAVADVPIWNEALQRNPRNREILLSQDPKTFIRTLERWMLVYYPFEHETVPGLAKEEAAQISIPVIVYRNGTHDPNHPRSTTDLVSGSIPTAEHGELPWPDDGSLEAQAREIGFSGLFKLWPDLAPRLHQWSRRVLDLP